MNRKNRILFVIDGLSGGGKERQLIELLRWIDRRVFEVGVVTFTIQDRHYVNDAKTMAHYFRELDLKKKIKLFGLMLNCFHEFDPDIVHTWDTFSMFYAFWPARSRNLPIIDGSIRDVGVDRGWEYFYKRIFLKRADIVLSNSHAGLNFYRVKGKVIYNAIDQARFGPNKNLAEYNLIMVANFTKYKDHDTFLKAVKVLVDSGIVDHVYLAGDGPNLEPCRRQVNETFSHNHDRVHFLGKIWNVEEWLSSCRVGVLCSTRRYSEGISNSVLEYMAAGLVTVATDTGAIPEIIQNGINGFIVKPGDWKGIVNVITKLKNNDDLFQQIVRNSIITLIEKFGFDCNMQKYVGMYLELLNNRVRKIQTNKG